MNATKALLSTKNSLTNEYHGVQNFNLRGLNGRTLLTNEGVKFRERGILPSLSEYFGETETINAYSLKELFFNMPFIHRTYCLTFPSQQEMFLPLTKTMFVYDTTAKKAHLEAKFPSDLNYSLAKLKRVLPSSMEPVIQDGAIVLRSVKKINWPSAVRASRNDIANLVKLQEELRYDLHYISGTGVLWYIKAAVSGPRRIQRRSPTLVLAAMHRLSEICRYHPAILTVHLNGGQNWLLGEFIAMSPTQFVDEMAAEITGHQFMIPNVRTPG